LSTRRLEERVDKRPDRRALGQNDQNEANH